jgi:hypothetical protein
MRQRARPDARTLPSHLERLLPGARADVVPLFVGGSWVPAKSNDSMAICKHCGTLFWRHATPPAPTPTLRRLCASARCLVDSRPVVSSIVTYLTSADYHRDRLQGARELTWRLCERGFGNYDGHQLAHALMECLVNDEVCGDVLADCADLLSRVVCASAAVLEGGWSPASHVVVQDDSLLRDLAEGSRAVPHVPEPQLSAFRARIGRALQAIPAIQSTLQRE